jgi:xanthine dehydrogenase YagR molybdenum-binding subunit
MNDLAHAQDFSVVGRSRKRIDGRQKVTGQALYPSDEPAQNAAFAHLVTSTIARGEIERFDLDAARSVAGVLDILTFENVGDEAKPPKPMTGGGTTTTLQNRRVWHDGQIIAVIVANSFVVAQEAAELVRVHYREESPSATFGSSGLKEHVREAGEHKDYDVGDADTALREAAVTVDEWYQTPTQHHNPIELFTTTCAWDNGLLTIWEPSQFVYGLRGNVAQQLGIPPEQIRVISKFIGGAFGSKGGATARTAWIAIAARRLNRPVKLVATRAQGFTIATYRAETRHHLQLGATEDAASPPSVTKGGKSRAGRATTTSLETRRRHGCTPRRISRPRSMSFMPIATRRASCGLRLKRLTCSRWNARWTSSPTASGSTRSSSGG